MKKKPRNVSAIENILKRIHIPIQVGGGIRDAATIDRYLGAGVQRVIIGTEAIKQPELIESACTRYPDQIAVAIDARDGKVAIDGWTETTEVHALDLARRFEDSGVAAIIFTDIQRDGMQTGPNIDATRELAEALSIPVIASGGVSDLSDIHKLLPLADVGVIGVITGRALYDGALDLKQAIAATHSAAP